MSEKRNVLKINDDGSIGANKLKLAVPLNSIGGSSTLKGSRLNYQTAISNGYSKKEDSMAWYSQTKTTQQMSVKELQRPSFKGFGFSGMLPRERSNNLLPNKKI